MSSAYIEKHMNKTEKKYISRILGFLSQGSEWTEKEMMEWLAKHEDCYSLEEDGNHYRYCLVSYPLNGIDSEEMTPEKVVLLVFEKDTVIADIAAVWAPVWKLQSDQETISLITEVDTWTESNLYVLKSAFFQDPSLYHDEDIGCIICNAYVTEKHRRKGLFTTMMQMVRDHVARYSENHVTIFQSISLDPDIACYGPDSSDEPYYYSKEKDDPKRMLNAEIIQHLNFAVVQLEHTDEDSLSDGSFIWYAIKAEHLTIVNGNEKEKSFS